jgi:tripartite-type tricarboxylate transporter receptor subunit TctC
VIRQIFRFIALGALALFPVVAAAQDYPARRITIYVPFPPGAIVDWTTRVMGEQLQKQWGQPVVIDNRIGAGGQVALQLVANSQPDGHTLVAYASSQAAIPVFNKNLGMDIEKDLVTITTSGYTAYFLVANGSLPVGNAREFIDYARSNPGKLNMALSAPNSTPELTAMEIMQRFGVKMTLVPYPGAAPAQRALLAGDVQLWIASMFGLDEYVKGGRLKVLAVLNDKPFPGYPDVPTFGSSQGSDIVNVTYLTYQTRSGTPAPILAKLASAIADIVATPEVRDRIKKAGFEPLSLPQDQAQKMMTREFAHARDLAKTVGLQAQ